MVRGNIKKFNVMYHEMYFLLRNGTLLEYEIFWEKENRNDCSTSYENFY